MNAHYALRQSHLCDEVKVGFFLMIAYCFIDLFSIPLHVNIEIAKNLSIEVAKEGKFNFALGWFQVFMLFSIAFLLAFLGQHRSRKLLDIEPLRLVDNKLAVEVDRMAAQITGRDVAIWTSANMEDGNAFCSPGKLRGMVVLGGGLRLQFRKARNEALATIAHELAHIRNADTSLMLVSLYVVESYLIIQIAQLVYVQAWFWSSVEWAGWRDRGYDWWDVIKADFPNAARNMYAFPSLVVVVVLYICMVRSREFYADTIASEAGYGEGLCQALKRMSVSIKKRAGIFHPLPSKRLRWQTDCGRWTQVDLITLASLSFIAQRLMDSWMNLTNFFSNRSSLEPGESYYGGLNRILPKLFSSWVEIVVSVSLFAIIIAACALISHHIYRVALSRLAIGLNGRALLGPIAAAAITSAIGSWLGEASSLSQLSSFISSNESEFQFIPSLSTATSAGFIAMSMAASAVVLSLFTRNMRIDRRWRLTGWCLSVISLTILFSLFISPIFSWMSSLILGMDLFSQDLTAYEFLKIQVTAFLLTIALLYTGSIGNKRSKKIKKSLMHPSRIRSI